MKRYTRVLVGALLASVWMCGVAACTPHGAAVGNTQPSASAGLPAHDNIQGARILVGIVGTSSNTATDRALLAELDGTTIAGIYMGDGEGSAPDAQASRIRAVDDLVRRRVHSIAISGFTADDAADPAWTTALEHARQAGIAVVFVDAQTLPADPDLYAASLSTAHDSQAPSFASVMETIVRDEPHDRTIRVRI